MYRIVYLLFRMMTTIAIDILTGIIKVLYKITKSGLGYAIQILKPSNCEEDMLYNIPREATLTQQTLKPNPTENEVYELNEIRRKRRS